MAKRLQESTSQDALEANLNNVAQDLTSQDSLEVKPSNGAQGLAPQMTVEVNLDNGAQDLTSQDSLEVNPNNGAQDPVSQETVEARMNSRIQELASKINMSCDEFVGEMRKRGCSEPTALKIWRGSYEDYNEFEDNDVLLSNLRKAADVLKVGTAMLLPR